MMHNPPPDHWPPDLVEARLIEAVQFAARTAGRAGPAGIGSAMPDFIPTLEDFLAEGWVLPDPPDEDEDDDEPQRAPTASEVTQLLAALNWVADMLAPDQPGRARAVNAWVFAKAYNIPFSRVIRQRGMSRSFAYTLRDQGLSVLSQRLQEQGVPPWPTR